MTTIYLGWMGQGSQLRSLEERKGQYAMLISYPYFEEFERLRGVELGRSWCLDSGAFTAKSQGYDIDLGAYTNHCLRVMRWPKPPAEIFGLDVIGDPQASEKNVRAMRAAGVPAIPTFHFGSPWSVLRELCAEFPKIGIGGIGGGWGHTTPAQRQRFIEGCFAIGWPKRFHGFGIGTPRFLRRFPFHTVDATTWAIAPRRFRLWAQFGQWKQVIPVKPKRDFDLHLAGEIDWFLRLERELKQRWAREMQLLEEL